MLEYEKWLREIAAPGQQGNKVAREALEDIKRLRKALSKAEVLAETYKSAADLMSGERDNG